MQGRAGTGLLNHPGTMAGWRGECFAFDLGQDQGTWPREKQLGRETGCLAATGPSVEFAVP
jgi:hypothetical protein